MLVQRWRHSLAALMHAPQILVREASLFMGWGRPTTGVFNLQNVVIKGHFSAAKIWYQQINETQNENKLWE